MHNDSLFKFIKKKFEEEGQCTWCENLKCGGSFEDMSGCSKFNEYWNKMIQPLSFDKTELDKCFEEYNE